MNHFFTQLPVIIAQFSLALIKAIADQLRWMGSIYYHIETAILGTVADISLAILSLRYLLLLLVIGGALGYFGLWWFLAGYLLIILIAVVRFFQTNRQTRTPEEEAAHQLAVREHQELRNKSVNFLRIPLRVLAMLVSLYLSWQFVEWKTMNHQSNSNAEPNLQVKDKKWTFFEFNKPKMDDQAALMQILWFDLNWSKDDLSVNDKLIISGKFHVFGNWSDAIIKPDIALLNAAVTGVNASDPVFIGEETYIGDQLVSSPVRLESGETYNFKVVLKARRSGDWYVHTQFTVGSGDLFYSSPDKKITIKGSLNDFNAPNTIPLQTDIKNIKSIEYNRSSVSVAVKDAFYRIPARAMGMTLTITNNGNSAVRLGELNIAGTRFLDPSVAQDETGYPASLLANKGLTVIDNSPLASGETRTVQVIAAGKAWEARHLSDWFINNKNNRLVGLLFFYNTEGNRQIVTIDAPLQSTNL